MLTYNKITSKIINLNQQEVYMKRYKTNSKYIDKHSKAYLTIHFKDHGEVKKIMTEVTILREKNNKVIITTDYKKTAAVDKWMLMDKKNYDLERQMLVGDQRSSSIEDEMYLNLVHHKGVCTQPFGCGEK